MSTKYPRGGEVGHINSLISSHQKQSGLVHRQKQSGRFPSKLVRSSSLYNWLFNPRLLQTTLLVVTLHPVYLIRLFPSKAFMKSKKISNDQELIQSDPISKHNRRAAALLFSKSDCTNLLWKRS